MNNSINSNVPGDTYFQQSLKALPVCAYTCNTDGLITFYNDAATILWGRMPSINDPADRFCGSFKLFTLDGKPIKHEDCFMARAIKEDKGFMNEKIIIEQPAGNRLTVLANINPIHNEEGEIIGAVNIIIDITEKSQSESDLIQLTDFLNNVFDTVPNYIFIKDREGRFVMVNKAVADAYGSTVEDLIGKTDSDFNTNKEEIDRFHRDDLDVINNNKHKFIPEEMITTSTGEVRWLQTIKQPLIENNGEVNNLLGISTDITERKQSEEKYRTLVENIPGVTFRCLYDDDWTMEFISENVEILTGYPVADFLQNAVRTYASIIHTEDAQYCHDIVMEGIEQNKPYTLEYRIVNVDGTIRWVYEKGKGILNTNDELICIDGVIVDITERKKVDEQLTFQATHDELTGLVNRREFERRAERVISMLSQSNDEHAMCFMDLDQFKVVNDTCGHIAGDELLRQLGAALKLEVRHRDTLARLGGDEFGVLMEHCSMYDAQRVAKSLLKTIQNHQFAWEGQIFKISVSIGLVKITPSTDNLTEYLRQADAACYMAKDLGRNRIHVYHTDDAETVQRHGQMQWVNRINQALEENRFCLYAQSIVPLNKSADTHYELLIRLIDDKGVTVPPGAFLPAAERYNLMVQLDRWVIEHAFKALVETPGFLKKINFISINLSGQSLADETFLNFVITQLTDTNIDSEKICFEITETAAIANLSTAIKFISTLKGLGCQFALDDFGSGLSSFGYLKNIPVDYLKIDGMFVKDIVDDPIDHAMVKSINEIGHVMGMQTIAEFVENDIIRGMLKEIGVNYGQGYGIDKPMPFEELLGQSNNVFSIQTKKADANEL